MNRKKCLKPPPSSQIAAFDHSFERNFQTSSIHRPSFSGFQVGSTRPSSDSLPPGVLHLLGESRPSHLYLPKNTCILGSRSTSYKGRGIRNSNPVTSLTLESQIILIRVWYLEPFIKSRRIHASLNPCRVSSAFNFIEKQLPTQKEQANNQINMTIMGSFPTHQPTKCPRGRKFSFI